MSTFCPSCDPIIGVGKTLSLCCQSNQFTWYDAALRRNNHRLHKKLRDTKTDARLSLYGTNSKLRKIRKTSALKKSTGEKGGRDTMLCRETPLVSLIDISTSKGGGNMKGKTSQTLEVSALPPFWRTTFWLFLKVHYYTPRTMLLELCVTNYVRVSPYFSLSQKNTCHSDSVSFGFNLF